MDMSVSVVIPVYNADAFVEVAIQSALEQSETAEIILVEDGSPDNSWEVCQILAKKYEKVRLSRHPGGVNRGAGASRNLGMEKGTCGYIAFLDADDFYLSGRFKVAAQIFQSYPACDGVYEAVGIHFDDEAGKHRWLSSNMSKVQMTTMTKVVPPKDLFRVLVKGWSGHIHLNGLVIKRSVLEKSGYMDLSIADTMHEDTDFILRAAAVGRLMPGRLNEPVAMRRVHAENRISAPRSVARAYKDRMKMRVATYRWCRKNGHKENRQLMLNRIMEGCIRDKPSNTDMIKKLPVSIQESIKLSSLLLEYPEVALEWPYWKRLTILLMSGLLMGFKR